MNKRYAWAAFERIPGIEMLHGWRFTGWVPNSMVLEVFRSESGRWCVTLTGPPTHDPPTNQRSSRCVFLATDVHFPAARKAAVDYAIAHCEF